MNSQKNIILHRRFLFSYKKNTLAIFLSFSLTFLLAAVMLVLIHTNHRIDNLQYQVTFTDSDCRIEKLSEDQIRQLKADSSIKNMAIQQGYSSIPLRCNEQTLYLDVGDVSYITMTAKLLEGSMPKEKNEVVAEKWVLLNLGIEPDLNQEFTIEDTWNHRTETVKLVGILSDKTISKKYGTLSLYTIISEPADEEGYTAYLKFQDRVSYKAKVKELRKQLGIRKKQVKKNPAREDFKELYQIDIQIMSVILLICMIVFYGIYRISLVTRQKQYGILRALGMKRSQLKHMILLELYQIYFAAMPVGIAMGILLSNLIIDMSGDRDVTVYLNNQSVQFSPVVPVKQIFYCVIIVAVLVGLIGYAAGGKISRKPVVEAISGESADGKHRIKFPKISKKGGKSCTLSILGCKYIFRDIKTSGFLILTICTGLVLFTGLFYRVRILGIYREDTKEMWYLNGQYEMSMLAFDSTYYGVSRESVKEIEQIPEVSEIKTAAGLPIRVIDKGNKRNDAVYDDMNARYKQIYGYSFVGNDGTDPIYKSILYGYNTNALKRLKKYIVSGDFDPEHMKEDEIILSILSTDPTKKDSGIGSYKDGMPLMDYQVGEQIQIKYRADFDTTKLKYETLKDIKSEYCYKTYKIAAIVYFPFMYDCNRMIYPLLITHDDYLKAIVPDSCFQNIYIDGTASMTAEQQDMIERHLILIGSKNSGVSTRSMIDEIDKNEMFYRKQMIYVCGIAVVAFVLVLVNMMNNIKYRMQIRTREICMLRAVGMSISMTKRMLLSENVTLGLAAVLIAYCISQPVLKYLYQQSDMQVNGHPFSYDYPAFFMISIAALLICAVLSRKILASWKTKQIMEGIGKVE